MRPEVSTTLAAGIVIDPRTTKAPTSSATTPAESFIARETAIFGRKIDARLGITLPLLVSDSPRAQAMREHFGLFVTGEFEGYEPNSTSSLFEPKLMLNTAQTEDRVLNTYGERDSLATDLYKAQQSRRLKDAVIERLGGQEAYEAASAEQRKEAITIVKAEFTAELISEGRAIYRPDAAEAPLPDLDTELTAAQKYTLISLAEAARKKALIDAKLPALQRLLANIKSGEDFIPLTFPTEMVNRARSYYSSLAAENPSTTREQLESNMAFWMADIFSIALLYGEALFEHPQIQAAVTEAIRTSTHLSEAQKVELLGASPNEQLKALTKLYFPAAKEDHINTRLVMGPIVALSVIMLQSIPGRPVDLPLYGYFGSLPTVIPNILLNKIKLPASYASRAFGLIEYAIFLLKNIHNSGALSELDQENVNELKKAFGFSSIPGIPESKDYTNTMALAVSGNIEALLSDEQLGSLERKTLVKATYKNTLQFLRFLNQAEYEAFIHNLKTILKSNRISLSWALNALYDSALSAEELNTLLKISAHFYATVSNEDIIQPPKPAPGLTAEELSVKVQEYKTDILQFIGKLSSPILKANFLREAIKAFPEVDRPKQVCALLRWAIEDYLRYRDASSSGADARTRFEHLKTIQQAERNIAAAYQILTLLEAYEAADAAHKPEIYNFLLSSVRNMQQQAEIRGYRSLLGQSSYFAEILKFVPAVTAAKPPVLHLAPAITANYRQIEDRHKLSNRIEFFKRIRNWIRQNPWTFSLSLIMGVVAIAAIGVLVLSFFTPAAVLTLPLVGVLVLNLSPIIAAAAFAASTLIATVALLVNSRNFNAAVKIEQQKLPELKLEVLNHSAPAAAAAGLVTPAQPRRLSGHSRGGESVTAGVGGAIGSNPADSPKNREAAAAAAARAGASRNPLAPAGLGGHSSSDRLSDGFVDHTAHNPDAAVAAPGLGRRNADSSE